MAVHCNRAEETNAFSPDAVLAAAGAVCPTHREQGTPRILRENSAADEALDALHQRLENALRNFNVI